MSYGRRPKYMPSDDPVPKTTTGIPMTVDGDLLYR